MLYPTKLKPAKTDLARDLVLYFPFNGTALDESGNGHNGTMVSTTATKDRFGKQNAALHFDGQKSEVLVSPPPKMRRTQFAISLWVCPDLPDSASTWQDFGDGGAVFSGPVIGQDDGYAIRCFQLWVGTGIVWHRMNEYSSVWTKGAKTEKRKWYHCVAMFDGTHHSLYVNNKPAMDKVKGYFKTSSDEPIRIGSKGEDNWPKRAFFAGSIDEVRIYSRVLTEDEIQVLYSETP